MINKNISIWRGTQTPPTNYHLWEKEDGGLYVYLDEKWQHLVNPTDKTILDEHQQQLDKIKNLSLTEIDPTDTNTYKSYQLKSDDNIFGTTINIPKDKFIKQVTLGYSNATIDTSTGNINIGTGLTKEYLLFSIILDTGNYELISINLSEFITEKDYSDGLEVVDNKLKVKIDPTSETYLKVSNNGIKVEGINNKVDKVEGKSLVSDTDITKLSELPTSDVLNINIADAKKAGTDAQTFINTHINDTDNPHNVTKAQVGLDQVNNTSDADKPVSTATQRALDSKVDKVSGKQLSTNDYTTTDKNKVAESINESAVNTLINTAIGKLTKASVGLDNVDNTADANKEVLSATKLKTAHTFWGQPFDGTTNVSGDIVGIGKGTTAKLDIQKITAPGEIDYIHMFVTEAQRPLVLQNGYGNVGIGVVAPVEKFEVDGNIKLTGSVKNVTEIYTTDGSKYAEPCTEDDIKALFA